MSIGGVMVVMEEVGEMVYIIGDSRKRWNFGMVELWNDGMEAVH